MTRLPLTALAAAVLATTAAAQGPDSLSVESYGQQSHGEDMARYGKVLKLSFRMLSAQVGAVEIAGGEAFGSWGLLLGAQRAEHVLPWRDTLLAAVPVAVGRGSFDAQGKAMVPLQLEGVGAGDVFPLLQLQFFMQAMALDGSGRPQTSHGLAFEMRSAHERRRIGDTDEDTWTISDKRYTTHFSFAQIASGQATGDGSTFAGWRLSFNVRLPDAGYQLRHQRTFRRDGVTYVLLSVQAPAAHGKGGAIMRHEDVNLGTAEPGRVRVHVADLVQGVPAIYKLAASLR